MTSATPARRTPPKATTATKATARKAPTDRKAPADKLRAEALGEAPEGFELLRPITDLRSQEIAEAQAQLIELFENMGVDLDAARKAGEAVDIDVAMDAKTIRALGSLSTLLETYSLDAKKFADWDRGPGSQERATNLAMWFLTALGE